jgi:predicted transcriptional regulator
MNAKQSAHRILEQMPDQASWTDIMYELYVKQKIEAGIKAAEQGSTIPHDQIKSRILAGFNSKAQ